MKPIKSDKLAAEMRSMRSRVSGWLRWLAGRPASLVTERAVRVWIVLASLVTILVKGVMRHHPRHSVTPTFEAPRMAAEGRMP